ncbi:MAG: peptidoglycan recognition family protein [Phycisphaerae bacterium]
MAGDKRTRMSLLCLVCGLMAVRCDSRPSGGLAVLPYSELDWSGSPPHSGRPGRLPGAAQQRHEWAAEGYRPWRYIVIHHSATDRGSAAMFDKSHRARGWDELGYHFVIDNGDGGPDGQSEVGHRWRIQKWGAHCGGTPNNEYNNYGIGICLVGDFTRQSPSRRQLASLASLVTYLARQYDIPPGCILGHCDAPNASTACPGSRLHGFVLSTLRPQVARQFAIGR